MAGTFSTVKKQELGTRIVAVKTYKKHHGQLVQRHYQQELWALRIMNVDSEAIARKNRVIYLLEAKSTADAYYLTFPYYKYTLLDFLEERDRQFALLAVQQMCQGLDFIHSQGIIHCDLSPSNVLVNKVNKELVLADFGCAHLNSSSNVTAPGSPMEEIGTRYYKAPEHLFGYRVYQPATDIWSLGTVFCHMLLGHPIFDGQSDLEQIGILVRALRAPSAKVKDEEMSMYPDADKLIFFGDTPQENDDDDDDDDYNEYDEDTIAEENRQPGIANMPNAKIFGLEAILRQSFVIPEDQALIRRMLTWSVKERITTKEIMKLVCPGQ